MTISWKPRGPLWLPKLLWMKPNDSRRNGKKLATMFGQVLGLKLCPVSIATVMTRKTMRSKKNSA